MFVLLALDIGLEDEEVAAFLFFGEFGARLRADDFGWCGFSVGYFDLVPAQGEGCESVFAFCLGAMGFVYGASDLKVSSVFV